MLRSTKKMRGLHVKAEDGFLGTVSEVLFDGDSWDVRYLVVDVGDFFLHKKVLIAPDSLLEPTKNEFPVTLSRMQINESPLIDTDKPVSLREVERIHQYYGWVPYWHAWDGLEDLEQNPMPEETKKIFYEEDETVVEGDRRSNLRSTKAISGYQLQATDEEVGHVVDFILDTKQWKITYAAISLKNWAPAKKVLIGTDWITRISWHTQHLYCSHNIESIRHAPEYDPATPVNKEFEEVLYDYYGNPKIRTKAETRHDNLHLTGY